jgi:hypothetical protein
VTLTIRTPAEGARVSRTLSLTDVPSALRARSIALAGAELLRSARASGDPPTPQDDAPAAESGTATAAPSGSTAAGDARETAAGERATDLPVADSPDSRATDASTERGTRLRESSLAGLPVLSLGLGPALRVLGKPYLALYGGEISLHWRRIGIVGAGLWGAQSDSLGTARFVWLDGSIALSVVRVLWQRWSLSGDVRGALGVVHADASATDLAIAVSATNMVWSAAAQLTLAYLLGSRWLLRLSLQTGYAAGPRFTADHRTLTAIAGPFIGIGLSTALALGK